MKPWRAWIVLVPFLLTNVAATTLAGEDDDNEEVEIIEEISDVTEIQPPAVTPPGTAEVIGRLHPAAVHVPIGWLFMLLIVDAGGLFFRKREWEKWGLVVVILTAASLLPAVATGLLRASDYPADESGLLSLHRNLMFVVAGLVLTAAALRVAGRRKFEGALRWGYFVLVLAAVGVVTVGGHIGGKLVFGEQHLPF